MAEYHQRGESIDYKNNGTNPIITGQVVEIGSKIGIAGCHIAPDKIGSVHVSGVFVFDVSGFTAGQYVKYDNTAKTLVSATDIADAHGWAVYDSTSDGRTFVKLI